MRDKAERIFTQLIATYGLPTWEPEGNAVDTLIGTILSANTNDVNSGRAFDQLCSAFNHDWDAVRTAPIEQIINAIRPAGMYYQKAPAIVAALEKIYRDQGEYTLDFLETLPVDEAMAYLTSFVGVGHKTASIVLLFCFNRASFPVDTHVQRISQRLGIVGRLASTEKVKTAWESLLPPEDYYPLHINLIRHGRAICKAQNPQCERCPLQEDCDYYQNDPKQKPLTPWASG